MSRTIRREDTGSGGWLRLGLAPALAAGLAAAAVASAISNIAESQPLPRVPLSGVIGPARMSELRFVQRQAGGEVARPLEQAARVASRADPLAYEPFLFAAAAYFPGQRSIGADAAVPLLDEALRRNPRSRQARALALRHAIGVGRLDLAVFNIRELHKVDQGAANRLIEGVGKIVVNPAQLDAALGELVRQEMLVPPLVRGFLSAPKSPELIVRLATRLPAKALKRADVGPALIAKLVDDGRFATARGVWHALGGRNAKGIVSNPAFAAQRAVPPFDWEFTQSASGIAEPQDGALFVNYYGRLPGPLVRQLLTLAPGTYRAVLDFEPLETSTGTIALRVACAAGGRELARRPIAVRAAGRAKFAVAFTVAGADCAGQYLELTGLPSEARDGQQFLVRRLDVVAGASA